MPGFKLIDVEGVGQTEHGLTVFHLSEALNGRRANALGRGVGSHHMGMLFLQLSQLPHQLIELGVGNLRIVQRVIAVVVMVYLLAELVYALLDFDIHG